SDIHTFTTRRSSDLSEPDETNLVLNVRVISLVAIRTKFWQFYKPEIAEITKGMDKYPDFSVEVLPWSEKAKTKYWCEVTMSTVTDRKSTRLNSSHVK